MKRRAPACGMSSADQPPAEPRCIDRFQVSHFRPVVMEIEIGGRSEKSLGGQESAAVDQECMGSNASSCSFALFDCLFFFCRNLSHVGGSE